MLQTPLPQPNTEDRETPPIPKPQTNMARFLLKYDHSKAKSGGMTRFQKHEAEGVRFSKGRVALVHENGNTDGYPTLSAMKQALERQGSYELEWVD